MRVGRARVWRVGIAALVALGVVGPASPAWTTGPTVSVDMPGGAAPDVVSEDLGRPGARGGTLKGPFGSTAVETDAAGEDRISATFSGGGDEARVDVRVPVRVRVNSRRFGEDYEVREPGPCKGLKFKMTEDFVRAHELEHVEHMKEEIRRHVEGVLATGKKQVVVQGGQRVETWTYQVGGTTGSPADPDWQKKFRKSVKDLLDAFRRQEEAEYAHAEKTGTFPRAGAFEGIERRARAKSCDEFMKGVGAQVRQAKELLDHAKADLEQSRQALKDAAAQARAAGEAARAALAAASRRPCDMEAFRRAIERYTKAADAATLAAEEVDSLLDAARDHVGEIAALLAAYETAKVAARVTAFPQLDRQAKEVETGRKALQGAVDAWTAAKAPGLRKVTEDLAAARETVKQALEKLKECAAAQDPRWQGLLDAVRKTLVPPPAAPPAPPATPGGDEARSEGPSAEGLRKIIRSLEPERPILPPVPPGTAPGTPPVYAPSPPPPIPALPLPPPPRPRVAEPRQPCAPGHPGDAERRAREAERRWEETVRARREAEAAQRRARAATEEPLAPSLPHAPDSPAAARAATDQAVARLAALMRAQAPPGPGVVHGQAIALLRAAPAVAQAPVVGDLETRLGLRRLAAATLGSIGVEAVLFEVGGGQTVPNAVAALAADPRVLAAQPNFVSATATGRRDALASLQYGPPMIRAPAAHARVTGRAVRVAVIDTGVDGHHPDLVGRIALRANFAEGPDVGEAHGTAVAGVIAAAADNGVGIYGIAPEAAILALRACRPRAPGAREGVCTSFALAQALDLAIVGGARVVNLSVAGPRDALLPPLVARAHERGVVVVAAVGNLGPAAPPPFPAALETVLAVTAVDAQAVLYAAAVHGPFVSVAAPGVEVLSTLPRGAYGALSGTSMAAAHVSGVAALLLQARPDLSPAAVRHALESTARPLAPGGPSAALGHGLVDGCRAVRAALGGGLAC
jgi:hypothetical protein